MNQVLLFFGVKGLNKASFYPIFNPVGDLDPLCDRTAELLPVAQVEVLAIQLLYRGQDPIYVGYPYFNFFLAVTPLISRLALSVVCNQILSE